MRVGQLPELRKTEGAHGRLTRVACGLASSFLHAGVPSRVPSENLATPDAAAQGPDLRIEAEDGGRIRPRFSLSFLNWNKCHQRSQMHIGF